MLVTCPIMPKACMLLVIISLLYRFNNTYLYNHYDISELTHSQTAGTCRWWAWALEVCRRWCWGSRHTSQRDSTWSEWTKPPVGASTDPGACDRPKGGEGEERRRRRREREGRWKKKEGEEGRGSLRKQRGGGGRERKKEGGLCNHFNACMEKSS